MNTINEKQWNFLRKAHDRDKLAQAYLFVGPGGVGKFDLAVEFVTLVNNSDKEKIISGNDPDVFVVEPEIVTHGKKVRKKDISIT